MNRKSLNDCFYEVCREKVQDVLDNLEDEDDETLLKYNNDISILKDLVIEEFDVHGYLLTTEFDCYSAIYNDVRIFQEMIEQMKKDDDEYTYDGDVKQLFDEFICKWISEKLDEYFGELIYDALCICVENINEDLAPH